MLDAGAIGGLIGVGVMACVVLSACLYDKKEKFQQYWVKRRVLHQPLLPVIVTNPVLVRSGSKQWKLKELVVLK
jgi:hypothetical protein